VVDSNLPAATVWTASLPACRCSAVTVNLTGSHPVDGTFTFSLIYCKTYSKRF